MRALATIHVRHLRRILEGAAACLDTAGALPLGILTIGRPDLVELTAWNVTLQHAVTMHGDAITHVPGEFAIADITEALRLVKAVPDEEARIIDAEDGEHLILEVDEYRVHCRLYDGDSMPPSIVEGCEADDDLMLPEAVAMVPGGFLRAAIDRGKCCRDVKKIPTALIEPRKGEVAVVMSNSYRLSRYRARYLDDTRGGDDLQVRLGTLPLLRLLDDGAASVQICTSGDRMAFCGHDFELTCEHGSGFPAHRRIMDKHWTPAISVDRRKLAAAMKFAAAANDCTLMVAAGPHLLVEARAGKGAMSARVLATQMLPLWRPAPVPFAIGVNPRWALDMVRLAGAESVSICVGTTPRIGGVETAVPSADGLLFSAEIGDNVTHEYLLMPVQVGTAEELAVRAEEFRADGGDA